MQSRTTAVKRTAPRRRGTNELPAPAVLWNSCLPNGKVPPQPLWSASKAAASLQNTVTAEPFLTLFASGSPCPLFQLDLIATCQAVATCKTRSYYGGRWCDRTARHLPTAGLQRADGNERVGGGSGKHEDPAPHLFTRPPSLRT